MTAAGKCWTLLRAGSVIHHLSCFGLQQHQGEKMAWDPPLKHPFCWMKPSSLFLSCSRAAVAQLIEVRNSLLYGSGGLGVARNPVFSMQVTQGGQEGQKAGNLRRLQGPRGSFGWYLLLPAGPAYKESAFKMPAAEDDHSWHLTAPLIPKENLREHKKSQHSIF